MTTRRYVIDPSTYSWTSLLANNWKTIKQEYDDFCKYVKEHNGIKRIKSQVTLNTSSSFVFPAEVIKESIVCHQAGKPLDFKFSNMPVQDNPSAPIKIEKLLSVITVPDKAGQTVEVEYSFNVLPNFQEKIFDGIWIPLSIYRLEATNPAFADFFPATLRLISQIPGLETAMYSLIEPGTHIKPHRGYSTDVLRFHLGLTPKQDAVLRVGDQDLTWDEGSTFIFDDTEIHEVWHRGDKTRIAFIVDFRRDPDSVAKYPEFVEARRRLNKLIDLQNAKR